MLGRLSLDCSSFGFDSKTSILGCVILLLFWKLFSKSRSTELLSKLPGPKAYPIVGNLWEVLAPRIELFRQVIERNKKYGPIFVVWLGTKPVVSLSDPAYVEEVLHSSSHLDKSFTYKFIEPFLGSGLITVNGPKWLKHRKILTPTFHFKILDSFFDIFREKVKIMTTLLDEKAEEGKPFDIYHFVKNCTLDIICEAAMGIKVNSQKEMSSNYVHAALRLSELITQRINKMWLYWDFIYYSLPRGKEFKKLLQSAHSFVDDIIEKRKKILQEKKFRDVDETVEVDEFGTKKRLAFLDLLLESAEKDNLNLTIKDIRDEVNTFMFAGHDTTTAAITWAIYLIGNHPKIQEDLYLEQKEICGGDMEKPVHQQDLPKMELLDRVMKESIRLFPSVPAIGRALDKDVKFGKYIVPRDTTVLLNFFVLHRNPTIYPEPEKFDPDRFLPEVAAKRHSYAFVPFSAGPRNCIGKRFALFEEKFTLASLIRRYVIESVDKPDDLTLLGELILRSYEGIKVTLKKRVHQ